MKWIYSLRTRLIVLYTGLILLGFGGLAFWAGQQIEAAAMEDFEHRRETEVAILAQALAEPIEKYLEGEITQESVAQILDNYSEETGSQLTLINNQGGVWESTYPPDPETVYWDLPEVITARANRITHDARRNSQGEWMIYTASPIIEDGRIISVVQLAVPLNDVEKSVRQRWMALGLGGLALGLIVVVISILLSASLTRPLARLRQAATQIAEGDFSLHLPDESHDELGQVARTFNAMSQRVQTMLEEQRAFASNVSHELRTPIMTIQLRIEALLDNHFNPDKQTRYLQEMAAEVERMKHLVDDLILLSRLDAGLLEIGRDHVDLPRFARQMVRDMQPTADAKAITITLESDENLPPISVNLTHLEVIFRNILDNSIKYMGNDGGQIHWKIVRQGNTIINQITDTGIGIAPEELSAVLQRFYRADKSHSRAIPGTGLGLALVQSVVKAYGGTLTLASAGLGHGTEVWVTWIMQ